MNKKITIRSKQIIDDEVVFDSVKTYNSEREFEDARQEAIENWKRMQGTKHSEIECYGEVCDLGVCLELRVDCNNDYEEWECIKYKEYLD